MESRGRGTVEGAFSEARSGHHGREGLVDRIMGATGDWWTGSWEPRGIGRWAGLGDVASRASWRGLPGTAPRLCSGLVGPGLLNYCGLPNDNILI